LGYVNEQTRQQSTHVGPASRRRTQKQGFSVNLLARTDPAVPPARSKLSLRYPNVPAWIPPTMMKSQSTLGTSSIVSYVADKPKVTKLITTARLSIIFEGEELRCVQHSCLLHQMWDDTYMYLIIPTPSLFTQNPYKIQIK